MIYAETSTISVLPSVSAIQRHDRRFHVTTTGTDLETKKHDIETPIKDIA
ncbi:hypothetical protein C486_06493 [Natrinema gari JCM 14663]|uniref:Uncharacterized protein n=1 Tax=Natrinema gari JCM 14663 TaxID=1230459 RepID=L9Z6V1_9EURY|nr:hypothetical protein C486_06493 [Natrinema gari JCM 14663]